MPGGEVVTAPDLRSNGRQAFLDQLMWTNQRLEWILDILLSDPEYSPVIVIQGDHGEPALLFDLNEEDVLRARFGIMNAYHLPNKDDSLLYPSVSPVNTFRIIFNYYLGADFDLLEEKSYLETTHADLVNYRNYLTPDEYGFTEVTDVVTRISKD